MERTQAVTLHGNGLTLIGDALTPGAAAPDFTALDVDLNERKLADYADKITVLCAVPSLDTPVCDLEIKRFNREAATVAKNVAIVFISMDLPFAQKRFCQTQEITQVSTLSDHRAGIFGRNYGVLIKELRLLSRAVFIVGPDNRLAYVEYVREVSEHPDYDAALAALRKLIGS